MHLQKKEAYQKYRSDINYWATEIYGGALEVLSREERVRLAALLALAEDRVDESNWLAETNNNIAHLAVECVYDIADPARYLLAETKNSVARFMKEAEDALLEYYSSIIESDLENEISWLQQFEHDYPKSFARQTTWEQDESNWYNRQRL